MGRRKPGFLGTIFPKRDTVSGGLSNSALWYTAIVLSLFPRNNILWSINFSFRRGVWIQWIRHEDRFYSLNGSMSSNRIWWILESVVLSWWCRQMETFSALLALCEGNPPVTGGFPSQRPVMMWSFDVFLSCTWTNGWTNNQDSGDVRSHQAHYGATVMVSKFDKESSNSCCFKWHVKT